MHLTKKTAAALARVRPPQGDRRPGESKPSGPGNPVETPEGLCEKNTNVQRTEEKKTPKGVMVQEQTDGEGEG